MEKKILYVYQSVIEAPLKALLQELHPECFMRSINTSIVVIDLQASEEALDYEEIYAVLKSDFIEDITMVLLHEKNQLIVPLEMMVAHIEQLKPSFYTIAKLLKTLSVISKTNTELIKRKLLAVLGQDLLDTARHLANANMNVSTAAKKAHMHRNTFMYRMEIIYNKTALDIANFHDLSVFTLLFS